VVVVSNKDACHCLGDAGARSLLLRTDRQSSLGLAADLSIVWVPCLRKVVGVTALSGNLIAQITVKIA
jgi:hypothetical protein